MILKRLRDETKSHHTALEQEVNFNRFTQDRDLYLLLLKRFYGIYVPIENTLGRLFRLDDPGVNFDNRRKTHLLQADLLALGISQRSIDNLSLCEHLPTIQDVPQAMGCLYVLEGSTLGGQIISRAAKENLNIDPETGGRFFSSYGASVGQMWRSFGDTLTRISVSSHIEDVVIESACETFSAFQRWLAIAGDTKS